MYLPNFGKQSKKYSAHRAKHHILILPDFLILYIVTCIATPICTCCSIFSQLMIAWGLRTRTLKGPVCPGTADHPGWFSHGVHLEKNKTTRAARHVTMKFDGKGEAYQYIYIYMYILVVTYIYISTQTAIFQVYCHFLSTHFFIFIDTYIYTYIMSYLSSY